MSYEIRPEDDLIEGVWPTFESLLANHGKILTQHIADWMDSDSFDQCMRDLIRDDSADDRYLNLDEIDKDSDQEPTWKYSAYDVFEEYLDLAPESVAKHFAQWMSNEDLAECLVDFIKNIEQEQDYLRSAKAEEVSYKVYVQYDGESHASYYGEYDDLDEARAEVVGNSDLLHYQIYDSNDELIEEDPADLDYEGIAKEYNVPLSKIYQKSQYEIEKQLGCEEGELDRFNYKNEQEKTKLR